MKHTVIGLIIWSVVAVLLIGVFCVCMIFDGNGLDIGINYNDESWNMGNGSTADDIQNLDIDWSSGKVTVLVSEDADLITLSDTYDGSDSLRMRWKVEDGTLKIRYSKRKIHLISFGTADKELTVTLPKSIAESLSLVDFDTASARISVSGLDADSLQIDNASGRIEVSGTYRTVKIDSSSGSVSCSGKIANADIESASGRITLSPGPDWETISIDVASGNVDLFLPEDEDGFTVDYDKASGKFNCDFPILLVGKNYCVGKGVRKLEVDAASGNLTIKKAEQ